MQAKECRCCGRSYDASGWSALAFVGIQVVGDEEPDLELRNCTCGTTLAILHDPAATPLPLPPRIPAIELVIESLPPPASAA